MKRFVLAAVLVAALGVSAGAQPPPLTAPPPKLPVTEPNVVVPPGMPPGPAIPFAKSGGVWVGGLGYYPYDSGNWLLGGTEGVTRQAGSYTMVFPGGNYPPAPVIASPSRRPVLGAIFHHKK